MRPCLESSRDKLPGVKSAEEEDDQSHNALGVPPLDVWAGGRRDRCWGGAAGLDQTQQAGVALTVCTKSPQSEYDNTTAKVELLSHTDPGSL